MPEESYIYQAEMYCEDCGKAIKAALDAQGKTPKHPEDERTFDSDQYPKGPYDDAGGEADVPNHCAKCHKPLLNDLTTAGVAYVLEYLREYKPGAGNGEVLDGWAD